MLVGLAVFVSLFYAEEDWRGWHAWQKFKREWEAKGEKFDFASVVPPAKLAEGECPQGRAGRARASPNPQIILSLIFIGDSSLIQR